jgi:protoporphyrinogen/coproporphyrinogen III oxidase
MRSVDVAVVGAGVAGICAALALTDAGHEVVVLEASSAPGGKAQSLVREGLTLQRGPHSFLGRHSVLWKMLRRLNLESEAVKLPVLPRFLARDGALHALQNSVPALATTGALHWNEKWSLVRELFRSAQTLPHESVHDFFARRFCREFAEGPLAAMVSGIWAADPKNLEMESCFPDLLGHEKKHQSVLRGAIKSKTPKDGKVGTWTLRNGFSSLGEAAKKMLALECDTAVVNLRREQDSWHVETSRESLRAKQLVVALDAVAAQKLLTPLDGDLGELLGAVKHARLSVVHWRETAANAARIPKGFGFLAVPQEHLFSMGTIDVGEGQYATFVGAENALADEATLLKGIGSDLSKLTRGMMGPCLHVERWEHAVAQPTLGHAARMATLQQRAQSHGIYLAGAYLQGGALKDAAATGFSAGASVTNGSTV